MVSQLQVNNYWKLAYYFLQSEQFKHGGSINAVDYES
jgi:hypothetical protein